MGYFNEAQIDRNARTGTNKKDCKHTNLSKEVLMGMKTGDYVCNDCLSTFSPDTLKEIRNKK